MNFKKNFIILICFLSAFSSSFAAEIKLKITPTDVYYLAKSIDISLCAEYNLTSKFKKKRLSNNIRPRNSYLKLLSVVDEFNFLHNHAIKEKLLKKAQNTDAVNTQPKDLYAVLNLIKYAMISENKFVENYELRETKTPSDVIHMLRQISFHNLEIAQKKGIQTDWASPVYVYDMIIKDILPEIWAAADDIGLSYEPFSFPKQPVRDILPLNNTRLLQRIYYNISQFYIKKSAYEPLILISVNDCDQITPGDLFDLLKAISAELDAMSGNKPLSQETAQKYALWKDGKKEILAGDVFRILQYAFIISEDLSQSLAKK